MYIYSKSFFTNGTVLAGITSFSLWSFSAYATILRKYKLAVAEFIHAKNTLTIVADISGWTFLARYTQWSLHTESTFQSLTVAYGSIAALE